MIATRRSKELDATIANKTPRATMSHRLTTHKNDQIHLDVTKATGSSVLISIVIYATGNQVTSQIVNIYAQKRESACQHVLKITDNRRRQSSDANKLLQMVLHEASTSRKRYEDVS